MNEIIKNEYQLSWLRALPLTFFLVFLIVKQQHGWFFDQFCYTGEGIHMSPCYGFFLNNVYEPLTSTASSLIILSLILFLLPNTVLRWWFVYVGSWAIPAAIIHTLMSEVKTGTFLPVSPAATASQWAFLLLCSIGVVVAIYIGKILYQKHKARAT